jgi:hypothetical protein
MKTGKASGGPAALVIGLRAPLRRGFSFDRTFRELTAPE